MKKMWALAALALLASNAAADETCGPLKIVGQAIMLSTKGALLVPARVDGRDTKMIIDTGGWYRELSADLVKELDLHISKRQVGFIDITGRSSNKSVTVSNFEIGTFKTKDAVFLVPDGEYGEGIGGLMGPQMFMVVDLDLDFAEKKVNFVLQDHCPGKVVYWKTPSYAVIPFVQSNDGHIRIPVELDGHQFNALLDTGADHSAISFRAAEGAFDITKDSPGVTKNGYVNSDKRAAEYKRTFKTLTIAGITFNNPTLALIPDLLRTHQMNDHRPPLNSHIDINTNTEGLDDVIVGLEELRHLHVYIAYKEQKVYISPIAEEPAQPDSAALPVRQTASP